MLGHLTLAIVADPPSITGPSLNADGLVTWGVKNLIPLLCLGLGIGIIANAKKGRISENAEILTNVAIGMCVIGGAALLYGFAGGLTSLAFGGS